MAEPRRLGDVLKETADRLGGTEQMHAYRAWAAAAGERLAAVTAPQHFAAGTLTVVCDAAVWAQELTYLSGEILEKMRAHDPACPVQRLRFVTGAKGCEKGRTTAPRHTSAGSQA
jgi:predicted nucleic acid-binding Zn ribbon protein